MLRYITNNRQKVRITWLLLSIMVCELTVPHLSFALSSGPVQPEISSFEPVGTTDMVDPFTGDFVYNIPLMDVEGYPINIAYHGGVTMEQEASWVGLGWNITPGAVNRGIRGLPDEFAGDSIEKEMYIKPEISKKIGAEVGLELAGIGKPVLNVGLGLGGYVTISNYRGVGVDFTTSAGINTSFKFVSAGVNVGASIGSQTGASINYGASVGVGISQSVGNDMSASGSFNLNAGGVYNPRTAHRLNAGINVGASLREQGHHQDAASFSTGTSVPIGLQNYSAVISNPCYMNSYSGQLKFGGELYSVYITAKINGSYNKIEYEPNGSRKGFGYYNLDKSKEEDMLDFSREKDGTFNPTMNFLPQSHLTYDVYSVSGQGTGGSFRPYRNDIGSVFDPYTKNPESKSENGGLEVGLGNLFEVGGEYTHTSTNVESGPWDDYKRPFTKDTTGYSEPLYFKEAGELTENNESYLSAYGTSAVTTPEDVANIPRTKPDAGRRVTRANHIYTHTGADADIPALVDGKTLVSYTDTNGFANYPNIGKTLIARVDTDPVKKLKRNEHQVTEIIQTQKDGRRYVYGLPVLNNVQREVTFAADTSRGLDRNKYLVSYNAGSDDSKQNGSGLDHLYSSIVTPTYVAAHLLTSVLSKDYIDVTGNGISDDDLGTYTKFNYTKKSSDYRWRSPIESGKAQYVPGYVTDRKDDKASYLIGSREQWLLHSIETRNYLAEFYVSKREDGKGVNDKILNDGPVYKDALYSTTGSDNENRSFKLDSIVLYNKHDRFVNGPNAQPIKTVLFSYSYSQCTGVPNSTSLSGKLTLEKIRIKYGSSNLNLSAGYTFKYASNFAFNTAEKDRWGYYKPNDPACNNFEFPYTTQDTVTDGYAKAWSLSEVGLPSGGVIKVDYEADDYAYVQDKLALEMFKVKGMGNSTAYQPNANQLYFNIDQQNLYFYFKRRRSAENPNLSFRDNYLKESKIIYYNIPVELADDKYEPIKGYAEVTDIGSCSNDADYGYVKLSPRGLEGSGTGVNPVTYTALNVGRYSLPHILFPGSDPDATDMDNVVAGMENAIKEMWGIYKNPLKNLIDQGKGQDADLKKAYVRLTSPGLKKKGGGQRVKTIKFYDSWDSMAGGLQAIYGKQYDYTKPREDGKGVISSGVASYEPIIGGDELPQRSPVGFQVQSGSIFPPNDPVDLYQEYPIGESFFPAPTVGYSRVTERSINIDAGRSSQSLDIHDFYTARDFPTRTDFNSVQVPKNEKKVTIKNIDFEMEVTQGFSITLNDMHGKPKATEHWMLKPAGGVGARELINSQQYDYITSSGGLDNTVPSFSYNAGQGKLSVANRTMGIESDLTIDSRTRKEESRMSQVSVSVNGFLILFVPIVIVVPIPFEYGNKLSFKCATVTKVTQQYGILDKVISNNQGAITTVKNEVFDAQTGNALVTSVNNQFGDREYSVSYPAHWAYKELGPSYENQDFNGTFTNPLILDSLGQYAKRFVNYNGAFSSHYSLPSNYPVARVIVDEEMPNFKIGDEILLKQYATSPSTSTVKAWVMGYTSNEAHCYLVLATRKPYEESFSPLTNNLVGVQYRIVRTGNKNRLGETIQSYTTTDSSNIFPYLKDTLKNLISLNAGTYNHNLNQVFAANTTSDSLNPFITGKVGNYRPELQVLNLKKRDYVGGTTRNAGTFTSNAYWKTEQDKFPFYCQDSMIFGDYYANNGVICDSALQKLKLVYLGNDSMRIEYTPFVPSSCSAANYEVGVSGYMGYLNYYVPPAYRNFRNHFTLPAGQPGSCVYRDSIFFAIPFETRWVDFSNGCCFAHFKITHLNGHFQIERQMYDREISPNNYIPDGGYTDEYIMPPGLALHLNNGTGSPPFLLPYRVRNKILLGKVGHYPGTDNENWVKTQQVTKYNWYGEELENKEQGIGYNSAVYGYNQQMPVCVAKNAKHGEVLFESFEDYDLLQPKPDKYESYTPLVYSPFAPLFGKTNYGTAYKKINTTATILSGQTYNLITRTKDDAHTGNYALQLGSATLFALNTTADKGAADGYTFRMSKGRKYVASIWAKAGTTPVIKISADTALTGSNSAAYIEKTLTAKSNLIDGWQQYEAVLDIPATSDYKRFTLQLGGGATYDDLRIYPFESNSKGFVYHPVTRKLMASLDENNFATFYEYDAEGNLVRTKKETDKGILTITESRSTHHKN